MHVHTCANIRGLFWHSFVSPTGCVLDLLYSRILYNYVFILPVVIINCIHVTIIDMNYLTYCCVYHTGNRKIFEIYMTCMKENEC